MSTFNERFIARREKTKSLLCVGLDPDMEKIPDGYEDASGILEFLTDIVKATSDLAVAYKPNLAFYEALGPVGWDLFGATSDMIRKEAPGALIIADAKRGDLSNTAGFYARAFFDVYDSDAITVNPYMGLDTLEPYLVYGDRGVIVLGLTSNPGAELFQVKSNPPMYELVARSAFELNQHFHNVWLVVGATNDQEKVLKIKEHAPNIPLLVPGVGAQGGDLVFMLQAAGPDQLINSSRGILYATDNKSKVVDAARQAAEQMVVVMRKTLGW